jgi:hypothetical protein
VSTQRKQIESRSTDKQDEERKDDEKKGAKAYMLDRTWTCFTNLSDGPHSGADLLAQANLEAGSQLSAGMGARSSFADDSWAVI